MRIYFASALAFIISLFLVGCGGGSSGGNSNTPSSFTISGLTSGLIGTVVLQDNNGDNLTVSANGTFTFAKPVTNGNTYNVTVLTQSIGQTCSVSNGAGTVSGSNVSNVSNVAVVCSTNTYSVGGTVSGLAGTVVLQNNGGDNLTVSANGSFTFATMVASGSPYNVTILTQPAGQSCSVTSGTSTISAANVTNVAITCGGSNNSSVTLGTNVGFTPSSVNGLIVAPSGSIVATNESFIQKLKNLSFIKTAYASTCSGNQLYKLDSNNVMKVVNVTQSGSDSCSVSPQAIFDTPLYTVIQYSGLTNSAGTACNIVPIRKSDGAMFCASAQPVCGQTGGHCEFNLLQTDNTGNLIYVSSYINGVFKVDMTNPVNPIETQIVNGTTDGSNWNMAVNSSGDAFVNIVNNGGSSVQWRIYPKTGGFQNISTSPFLSCLTNGYSGDDTNFYYVDSATGTPIISKLTSGSPYTNSTYFTDTVSTVFGSSASCYGGSIYKVANRIFWKSTPTTGVNYFVEAVNVSSTPVRWTVSALNTINQITGYSGGLAILGQDVAGNSGIVTFNTTSNIFTTALTPGLYSISTMSVSPTTGDITFGGRRSSDNAYVVGNIPSGTTTVNILNTQPISGSVVQITRIN